MIVPDVNLLLYTYDTDSSVHAQARAWWEALLSGSDPIGLPHVVIFGFIRVGTSARAFANPMTHQEAAGHVRAWLARPVVQVLETGTQDVEPVLRSLEDLGTAGNLVTDAQIAAAALAHDATVHSSDADFGRFPGLRWLNPLADARKRPASRRK